MGWVPIRLTLEMTLAVPEPASEPNLLNISSMPRVEANPSFGANHDEKTWYCATWVELSPRALYNPQESVITLRSCVPTEDPMDKERRARVEKETQGGEALDIHT